MDISVIRQKCRFSISYIKYQMQKKREKAYAVEKVIEKRFVKGNPEYKIKWKDYPEAEATWEPAYNLSSIYELIMQYENRLLTKKEENSDNNVTVLFSQQQTTKGKMVQSDTQKYQQKGSVIQVACFDTVKSQTQILLKSKVEQRNNCKHQQSNQTFSIQLQSKKISMGLDKIAQKAKNKASNHIHKDSKKSQLQAKIELKKQEKEKLKKIENKLREGQKRQYKKRKSSLKKHGTKYNSPYKDDFIAIDSINPSNKIQSRSVFASNYKEEDKASTQNKSTKIPAKAGHHLDTIEPNDRHEEIQAEIEIRQLQDSKGKKNEYLIEYSSGTLKVFKTIELMRVHPEYFAEYLDEKKKRFD